MKLSEAIRLGAMLAPQGFEDFVKDLAGVRVTCALGAAAEAIGSLNSAALPGFLVLPTLVSAALEAVFGEILNVPRRRCPVKACRVRRVTANVIVHLNDDHRWTREQIAEWVDTLERAHRRRGLKTGAQGERSLQVPVAKGSAFRPDSCRV